MNFLQDRRIKRKRFFYATTFAVFLFIFFYYRSPIFAGLSGSALFIFRPVLTLGSALGERLNRVGSYFASKNSLYLEIENLKLKISEEEGRTSNYNTLQDENTTLKETLGRMDLRGEKRQIILSAILGKPNVSPYDTLLIDVGADAGVKKGDMVFASGNIPLGNVSEAYADTSKVVLFSSQGVKQQVVVKGSTDAKGQVFMEVVGRGGGNFEMILPRNFTPVKGDEVALPGINPYTLGIVEIVISDPRDPFVKALLVTPVNIQELKFVEVEK